MTIGIASLIFDYLKMGIYLLAQFFMLLGFTALFLFTYQKYEINVQLAGGAVIIFGLLITGGLFENRKWAANLEILRLCSFPAFGFLIHENIFALNAAGIAALSLVWFIVIRRSKKEIIVT